MESFDQCQKYRAGTFYRFFDSLDPIYVTNMLPPTKLTAVSYSPNSDVSPLLRYRGLWMEFLRFFPFQSIIVGTNDGSLWVYAIKNLPPPAKVSLDNWSAEDTA